ncbi:DUF3307 domain-containing protein [Providencia rettgeri]|uniref:DUF3307 domain-containing protein n=1 Tax=Providencia rettgeri TaxID=587 RepID=UPI001B397105|nr:DUF3307 domain-containing protein [Providencia rettgeri]MBQ0396701.1 DUF3307 domain-containing protein [Providencia rettgeri]
MYYFFILALISHVIFDFYFQSKTIVNKKKFRKRNKCSFWFSHIYHASLHYLGFFIAAIIFFTTKDKELAKIPFYPLLLTGLCILFSHLVIDIVKEFLNLKYKEKEMLWFLFDQFFHVVFILLTVIFLNKFFDIHVTKKEINQITPLLQIFVIFLGILILIKPASIFVMKFLDLAMYNGKTKHISITKSHLEKIFDNAINQKITTLVTSEDLKESFADDKIKSYISNTKIIAKSLEKNKNNLSVNVDTIFSTNNGGKWIGYTERIMIFSLYLLGQFTAIAAVMAIKTAFRFNDLKDDSDSQRSEYIMLGTFSSLFITIIISVLVGYFIKIAHFSEFIIGFKSLFE